MNRGELVRDPLSGSTKRALACLTTGLPQRGGYGDRHDRSDERQRDPDRYLPEQIAPDELRPDEDQYHREPEAQVHEALHQTGEHEVQGAQDEDGKGIGGPHHERVCRDREDRRYGVNREDYVGGLHRYQDRKQRRRHELAPLPDEELLAAVAVGHGQYATEQAQDGVPFGVNF